MNQELRERAEKYAEPVQSVCRGQAYALKKAYLAGAKDQAEQDAITAHHYCSEHYNQRGNFLGQDIADAIRASVEG